MNVVLSKTPSNSYFILICLAFVTEFPGLILMELLFTILIRKWKISLIIIIYFEWFKTKSSTFFFVCKAMSYFTYALNIVCLVVKNE